MSIKLKEDQDVVVVIVPFPAQGHLNQLLNLSRRLSALVPVYFVGTGAHNHQTQLRAHILPPPNLHFHDIINPKTQTTNATKTISTHIPNFPSHFIPCFEATRLLRGPVSSLLARLSAHSRRVVVVHDGLMAHVVQDIATWPNVESYTFPSVSAFSIFTFLLDVVGRDALPPAFVPEETPSMEGCLPAEVTEFMASQSEFEGLSSGYVFNTTRVIEKPYVDALDAVFAASGNKRNWAIGPLNYHVHVDEDHKKIKRHACLEWLDRQGRGSVVYVSFGTTTTFGKEQEREIGTGLRDSGHKFLWVAREADRGDGLSDGEAKEKEMVAWESGVVVREWAPQTEILGHPAVGGFVSHCGWNSCLEGISGGVAIGTWPMHSDQPRNAVLLTEVLRVGVSVREWTDRDEVASAAAVSEGVRRLMGAAEVRNRAAELGRDVRRSAEEGGGSSEEFGDFVAHITRQ